MRKAILSKQLNSKQYKNIGVLLEVDCDYSVSFKPLNPRMDRFMSEIDPYSKTSLNKGHVEIMRMITNELVNFVFNNKIPYISFNNLDPKVIKTYIKLFNRYNKNIKHTLEQNDVYIYIYFNNFL